MKSAGPTMTPLMRQYSEVKNKYPDSIVLFRMGDFYETFNEDAKITAKILGIVLTKRSNGAAGKVPLAGFPYHALDNYLPKLVNAGHRVAICEQVEDPKLSKGIVRREVIEVVTPGTLSSEQALSQKSNQFLACITSQKEDTGYAILDSSTGEFFLGECPQSELNEALRKFAPREILVSDDTVFSTTDWYRTLKPFVTQVEGWIFDPDQSYRILTEHFGVTSLKGFGCENYTLGICAGGVIFYHVRNHLNGSLDHISTVRPVQKEGVMGLDAFTVRNLEVFQSLATQGTHGTLLDILDDTQTAGGGRLLKRWVNQPLTDKDRLNGRLNIVEGLVGNKRILETLQNQLKSLVDIERVLGRMNQEKATPREVEALADSLEKIPDLSDRLEKTGHPDLMSLSRSFKNTDKIVKVIRDTLAEDAPAQLKQGNVIASGVDEDLDEARVLASGGKQWIAQMQESERTQTGIPSLKVGFNNVFGYYIEVTKTHNDKVPDSYIRKQTLVHSERYFTPDLKEYEEKILSAEEKMAEIEFRIFYNLCNRIMEYVNFIQVNARILNRLDLLACFANLAVQHRYCRPQLTDDPVLAIKGGRHPVVEQLLPATERFVPNDLEMDVKVNQIHLITGPNMAGKSTYLRQIGLLVLMAQIGSYVPAESAQMGMVDRLFTRVGASDNLAGGESTFLVEMNEAANILNNATDRSLVLLDEIGRGTATYDGLSIAWAVTEYLHNEPTVAARTLFATHYHELTSLERTLDRLENHHAAVKEVGDTIVFQRKIKPGSADKSYGIHVARMAGLPDRVIQRSMEILVQHLEGSGPEFKPRSESPDQMVLFNDKNRELRTALRDLDINSMTPLEALQALDKLKRDQDE